MNRVIHPEATAEVSDRELVDRCRAGDEEAFDTLVLRHRGRAFNIAYSLLMNHEDAAEIAQDAFVKVYQNLVDFRGDCEFTTWLYQIVSNLARNRRRWWMRRGKNATISLDCPTALDTGVSAQVAATDEPPDAESARTEFEKMLEEKIAGLPTHYREVLLLRTVEDMSYETMAVVLQCSIGTVKSRLARARGVLRQAMPGELR